MSENSPRVGKPLESLNYFHYHMFLYFHFATQDDKLEVQTRGSWIVSGQVLALEDWRPELIPSRDPIRRMAIWICFSDLPSEMWSTPILLHIAARAGKPIAIDKYTERSRRGHFARACVEVDFTRPLVPGVHIRKKDEDFWQRLEYEGIDVLCFNCVMIGHKHTNLQGERSSNGEMKQFTVSGIAENDCAQASSSTPSGNTLVSSPSSLNERG